MGNPFEKERYVLNGSNIFFCFPFFCGALSSAFAGSTSLAYSYFGEGMTPFDIKALTQAGLIAGSYFMGESLTTDMKMSEVREQSKNIMKESEKKFT